MTRYSLAVVLMLCGCRDARVDALAKTVELQAKQIDALKTNQQTLDEDRVSLADQVQQIEKHIQTKEAATQTDAFERLPAMPLPPRRRLVTVP